MTGISWLQFDVGDVRDMIWSKEEFARGSQVADKESDVYTGIAEYRQQATSDGSPGCFQEKLPRDGTWRALVPFARSGRRLHGFVSPCR